MSRIWLTQLVCWHRGTESVFRMGLERERERRICPTLSAEFSMVLCSRWPSRKPNTHGTRLALCRKKHSNFSRPGSVNIAECKASSNPKNRHYILVFRTHATKCNGICWINFSLLHSDAIQKFNISPDGGFT